jgi:phospholipid/cholesterol/gamma-HCH transport system substrate-binding protein
MAQTYKFRYVNEIVGSFVILIVLLLLAGVFFAGHAQRWFEPVHKLTVTFPPEGSFGLTGGAEVVILGTVVGSLERITVSEDGTMAGEVVIKGDFIRFVRADSKVVVKKKFVVAGDSYIEITKGKGAKLPERATLPALKDTEITEMIEDLVAEIREKTLPAIDQAKELLSKVTSIASGLEEGKGPAGKLLRDDAMAEDVKEIVAKANQSLSSVRDTLAKLPPMAETLSGEVKDMPGLVIQTRDMLRETQRLIEAFQRHWLIRGYVDQAPPSDIIPAETIGISK